MKYPAKLVFIAGFLSVTTAYAQVNQGAPAPQTAQPAPVASAADARNCYTTFYKTKDMGCVEALIAALPKLRTAGLDRGGAIEPAMLGFFAEVFSTYPQEKSRLLALDVPSETKILFTEALYEADLQDEAQRYASANGFAQVLKSPQISELVPVKKIKPVAIPGDNDLLISAYMASGNKEYINRVLENFSSADDGMVRDSLRISMMQSKFGPTFAAPGREKIIMPIACQKYECKKDPHNLMRVLTLSSAFWAIRSLSQQDAIIKKTFIDFFEGNPRLKKLLFLESNAFSNYMTLLVAYAAIKDNSDINNSLSAYEKLGSDQETMPAWIGKKNPAAVPAPANDGSVKTDNIAK